MDKLTLDKLTSDKRMPDNHRKVSKLLLLLAEYLGFSLLCGWVIFLFFSWCARVISSNYSLRTGAIVSVQTEYWLRMLCVFAGIVIAIFILFLLLQRKLSYILKISTIVEEMESGHLDLKIPLEGADELTDLAGSVNHLATAMSAHIEQTEQLTQERFGTIATLSHDLRTPLTSVMSYLQFIRDGQYQTEEQLLQYVEQAYTKAGRIKELSDHLFDNCKDDASADPSNRSSLEEVEGATFFQTALAETEVYLTDHGYDVDIISHIANAVFFVRIDHSQISRIFENMLSNIEKYADAASPIIFTLELNGSELILQQKNKVLAPHLRSEVESNQIGLTSMKQGIGAMNGSLLAGEEGHSFTLEIHLPLC